MAEALSENAAAVRRWDYDRFLVTLFAPPAARENLFALYAFNIEIAKVRETVSEPMLGRIRLQWWREALDDLDAGKVRENPVVRALSGLVGRGAKAPLTREYFDRLIDAREFDLEGRVPATMAELEAYCEGTSSALLWVAAEALEARSTASRDALQPLGIAWALTGHLRALPNFARMRRTYVPAEIAAKAGLKEEGLFTLKDGDAVARCVSVIAHRAREHVDEAKRKRRWIEPAAQPLFLFATLTDAYLARLARIEHRVTDRKAELAPAAKVLRLWWAARFR